MGSGVGAAREAVDALVNAASAWNGDSPPVRPFPAAQFISALPPSVRSIAVLDRTKEPGAVGEPLYLDVRTAVDEAMEDAEAPFSVRPRIIGGRYGLSSKEIHAAHGQGVLDELTSPRAKAPIHRWDLRRRDVAQPPWTGISAHRGRSERFRRSSSGWVRTANRGAEQEQRQDHRRRDRQTSWQGYFVYDSKKSGAMTASPLRFGPEPIHST